MRGRCAPAVGTEEASLWHSSSALTDHQGSAQRHWRGGGGGGREGGREGGSEVITRVHVQYAEHIPCATL